jgi:hypothetical protein
MPAGRSLPVEATRRMRMQNISGWDCYDVQDGRVARLGPVLAACTAEELTVTDPTISASIPRAVMRWLVQPMLGSCAGGEKAET